MFSTSSGSLLKVINGSVSGLNRYQGFSLKNLKQVIKRTNKCDESFKSIFGVTYTDHMFEADYTIDKGWCKGIIKPLEDLKLHPGSKTLHYGVQLFEGIKAYRGDDGIVRIFRLDQNMKRMVSSAERAQLPTFNPKELGKVIQHLVGIDINWVPKTPQSALYIRPALICTDSKLGISLPSEAKLFVILTPMTSFYLGGLKPRAVLYADPKHVRAFEGGVGAFKMGGNYAPTFKINVEAEKLGCNQVLWLYGKDELLTEVGAMNVFAYFRQPNGRIELATPTLSRGIILPGIVRDSVLQLAKKYTEVDVSERDITIEEIFFRQQNGTLLGLFGTGTAVGITPISMIKYRNTQGKISDIAIPINDADHSLHNKLTKALEDIQYGRVSKPEWQFTVKPVEIS